MRAHTLGPWKLCTNELEQEFVILGADSTAVAFPHTTISSKRAKWSNKKLPAKEIFESVANEVERANANLIAAAPDLLAVVEELEESAGYWGEYDVPLGIVDRIRAALAKARP